MDYKKLEKAKESIQKLILGFFQLLVVIVDICITIFLVVGSAAAIIILCKMFPDTALIFMNPLISVFSFILKIFYMIVIILILLLYGYINIAAVELTRKIIGKREKERKRFLDNVVKKLKKELKK